MISWATRSASTATPTATTTLPSMSIPAGIIPLRKMTEGGTRARLNIQLKRGERQGGVTVPNGGGNMQYQPQDREIFDHYNRYLRREHTRLFRVDAVFVMEFAPSADPSSEDHDWMYTTVGASRQPLSYRENQAGEVSKPRVELMLYARHPQEALADALTDLATYPSRHKTFFAPGHTVAGSAGHGIVAGSPLTEILLTRPYFQSSDIEVIHHSDGSHTHILWVIPLYPSERRFVRQRGASALIDLFCDNETDTSDLWRPPTV